MQSGFKTKRYIGNLEHQLGASMFSPNLMQFCQLNSEVYGGGYNFAPEKLAGKIC